MQENNQEIIYYDQWLQSIPNLTARWAGRLLKAFPCPQEILKAPAERLEEMLPPAQLKAVLEGRKTAGSMAGMQEAYERLGGRGICFVSCRQEEYPRRLLAIPDPPAGLYYRGKLPGKDSLSVAVIGSRECSEYGCYAARELGSFLGRRGVDVISGMARGIDGISQRAALEAGGASYGVLGCGVDVCYPSSNRELYDCLTERGGILSAYPPGTPPLARNFPPRNRIVSGLADVLVVVEARMKSGTLITVDMALEQGREVYAVPGRVTDRLSDGCNQLLKQGAGVYLDPESFLEELEEAFFLKKITPVADQEGAAVRDGKKAPGAGRGRSRDKESAPTGLDGELTAVWNGLDFTPKSLEEISRGLDDRYSTAQLSALLMRLTLEGAAKQVSPGYFCREG